MKYFEKKADYGNEIETGDYLLCIESQLSTDINNFKITLGVKWNLVDDAFRFSFNEITEFIDFLEITKWNMWNKRKTFYDTLVLISPITPSTKSIFQLLFKDKQGWDDSVLEEIKFVLDV